MELYRKKKLNSKSYNFFTGFHHIAYLESIKGNCDKTRTNSLPKLGYLAKKSSPRIGHYSEIRRLVHQNDPNKDEAEADSKTEIDNDKGFDPSCQQDYSTVGEENYTKPQQKAETTEEEKDVISSKTILNSVEKFEQYLELRQLSHSSLKKNQTKSKPAPETKTDKNIAETTDSKKHNTGLNFVEAFYLNQKKLPDKTVKATKEDENYDDLDYFEKFNKILEKHRQRDLQNNGTTTLRVPRIVEEEEEDKIEQRSEVKQRATNNFSTKDFNCDENKDDEKVKDTDSTANLNYFEKFYHILEKNRRKNLHDDLRAKENRRPIYVDRPKQRTAHGRGDSDNQKDKIGTNKTNLNFLDKCKRTTNIKLRENNQYGDVCTQTGYSIKLNKNKSPPPLLLSQRENHQNSLTLKEIKEKFCPSSKIKPRNVSAQEWQDAPRPSSNLSFGTEIWDDDENTVRNLDDDFETKSEHSTSTTITISSRKISLSKILHELEVVENQIQQEVRRKSSTLPFAPPTPPPPPPPPLPFYNTNIASRLVENMKTLIVQETPKSLKEGFVTWDESKSQSEVSMAKFPRETKTAMMMLFNRPKPRSKLPRRLTGIKQVETQTTPSMSAIELRATPCVKNLLCTKGLHSGRCYGTSETSLSYTSSFERKYLNLKFIQNMS